MPLHETTLQRQLDRAKEELAVWVKVLDGQSVDAAKRRKNTKWRHLNAACNTIRYRLKTAIAVRTRDEEVAKHKAERLAAPVVEKPVKKGAKGPKVAAKEKAPKKEKPPKAEGAKGEAKEKKKKE